MNYNDIIGELHDIRTLIESQRPSKKYLCYDKTNGFTEPNPNCDLDVAPLFNTLTDNRGMIGSQFPLVAVEKQHILDIVSNPNKLHMLEQEKCLTDALQRFKEIKRMVEEIDTSLRGS